MEESLDNITSYICIAIVLVLVALFFYLFQPALSQKSFDESNILLEKLPPLDESSSTNDANTTDDEYLLSLIIPAYNEEERLPPMLKSTIEYLHKYEDTIVKECNDVLRHIGEGESPIDIHQYFQIIIVNDGSSDGTVQSVKNLLQNNDTTTHKNRINQSTTSIKLLTLKQNSGKGAAVKAGMLHSKSKLSLMLDADGATTFSSIHALLHKMKTTKAPIAFGSRAHLQEKSKAQRSFVRTLLMNAFHMFVEVLIGGEIRDTQCGFKLFRGEDLVGALFETLHLQRWAFDTELVVIAERLGVDIVEVGVEW